jgi:ribonuclease-3
LPFIGRNKQNNKVWGKDYPAAKKQSIESLNKMLGYRLNSPRYFIKALTHRSYLELSPKLDKSYERLEFLGDAVLGMIVAEYLFNTFNDKTEGFLTKTRSQLVNKEILADAGERINLKEFILYDKRFLHSEDKGMRSIIADGMEALIGAIYLDAGVSVCRKFILKNIVEPSIKDGSYLKNTNYKGILLEHCHSVGLKNPLYQLVSEEGPEHSKKFIVEVKITDDIAGKGEGDSKKNAEQNAAKNALENIERIE